MVSVHGAVLILPILDGQGSKALSIASHPKTRSHGKIRKY